MDDLSSKFSRGEISPDAFYDRRKTTSDQTLEQIRELADRTNSEILSSQQSAAIKSAELIKSSNERSFGSLKDSISSILDAIETKGKNAFQAIGETLKRSLLGAVNDVISSQITQALFGVFNPGRAVTGFEPPNGIRGPGISGFLQGLGGAGATPQFAGSPINALTPMLAVGGPSAGNLNYGFVGANDPSPTRDFLGGTSFGSLPAMANYPQAFGNTNVMTLTPEIADAGILNSTLQNRGNPFVAPGLPPQFNPGAAPVRIPGMDFTASSPDGSPTAGSAGGGSIGDRFGVSPSLLSLLAMSSPAAALSGAGGGTSQAAAYQASQGGMPTMLDSTLANYPQLLNGSAPGGTPGTGGDGMPTMLSSALTSGALATAMAYGGGGAGMGPQAIPNALALAQGAQAGYTGITPLAHLTQAAGHGGIAGVLGVGSPTGTLAKLATKGGIGLSALQSTFYNSGSIPLGAGISTTAAGISQAAGGGIFGSIAGGAAGFASSPAAGALGTSLFLNGISAKNQTLGTSIETVGGAALAGFKVGGPAGAITGAGIGLFADGIKRGGGTGVFEDAAGGAIVGAQYGGPIGAAIGAVIGATAGIIRLFVKTNDDEIIQLVKSNYKINISRQFADQINQIAKTNFNGSIHAAVQSPQVLQLLQLYAQSTGQKFGALNIVRPLLLTDTAKNGLQQGAFYQGGQAYSFQSNVLNGVYGGVNTTVVNPYQATPTTSVKGGVYYPGQGSQPSPSQGPQVFGAGTQIHIHNHNSISGDDVADLFSGATIETINSNPRIVAGAAASAQDGSYDRQAAAARALAPQQGFW